MNTIIQATAKEREIECLVECLALQLRVHPLKHANLLTVLLPALIPILAGAELFGMSLFWKYAIGIATLIASLLVAIHKVLNCDAFQMEADRMQRGYYALALRYRTIFDLNPPDSEARLLSLDEALATLKESGGVTVPDRYRVRAQKLFKVKYTSSSSTTGRLSILKP